jgi:NADPH:quinone reductase-like Zn-dependent oxidoreductase/acyl dehydratase
MKAVQCTSYGLPERLVVTEVAIPEIAVDDVLIKVKACGVNFPDVLIIQDKYQFHPPLPFAPGGEVSGTIISVGENVKHLKQGDRVLALCGWGGFAEQVVVNAKRVFLMSAEIDFITAATTLYTYGTSYHALKDRAVLTAGETLLVLGAAGGVGLAAVELGKVMGAIVIAAASTDEKLAICKLKGADFTINYSTEDLKTRVKEITADKGVDVVYDPIGGSLAEVALRSIAWKGRYLVVGFAAGEIPKFPNNLALLKGCSIVGVFWGSFAEREPQNSVKNSGELLALLKSGKIKQHLFKTYSLEEAPKALTDLIERKVKGKAVVKVGDWKEEETITRPIQNTKPGESFSKLILRDLSRIGEHVGQTFGPSSWATVTQEMINDFANATHDHQWIHVDVERAKTSLPEGKTIAHGYLTLSLVAKFFYELVSIDDSTMAINYGVNKVRFPAAVKVNSCIRMTAKLTKIEEINPTGSKLFFNCHLELEGSDKPACVAEVITALYR